jgi:hypothetical protein
MLRRDRQGAASPSMRSRKSRSHRTEQDVARAECHLGLATQKVALDQGGGKELLFLAPAAVRGWLITSRSVG